MIKVKKCIGYFWKLCVHKVIDFADINYTDTCWISCWLCRHDVGVVVDHVDILSKYWLITWTPYQRSCWLHGHNNDYLDTFEKLCRFLTDFKGTIMQKRYLVYKPNSNAFKLWKSPYLHAIFELCNQISLLKR